MPAPDLSSLTAASFREVLGDGWHAVMTSGERVALALRVAEETGGAPYLPGGRLPFRLLFEAPAGTSLLQGVYLLQRDGWGEAEVFLVPLQPAPNPRFEAIFG